MQKLFDVPRSSPLYNWALGPDASKRVAGQLCEILMKAITSIILIAHH
jgi:hypothetical protein